MTTQTITADDAYYGFYVLSEIFKGDPEKIGLFLGGLYDDAVKTAIAYRKNIQEGGPTFTKESAAVVERFEQIRRFVRAQVSQLFEKAGAEEYEQEQEKQKKLKSVIAELKASNKPHPMGTVNQLAEMLGVSKSEVRRRKQDNTLAQLLIEKGFSQ